MGLPVKVCGITRPQDAHEALRWGARALGFVFYPRSPRYVAPADAAAIVRGLPPFVTTVGVFVDAAPAEMNRIAGTVGLDRLQLHGSEPHAMLAELARPGYRAFRLREAADAEAVRAAPDGVVLLDAYVEGLYGGTGRTFDWRWARELARTRTVILSGGLTADNVAAAVEAVAPAALDVSSGVEAAPGRKSPEKLAAFFTALHHWEARTDTEPTPNRGAPHARAN